MSGLKSDFKKVGGLQKIEDFAKQHVLGTVCGEIVLLGTSHKALEIANLSAQFKIYKHLKKRYGHYVSEIKESVSHKEVNHTVWICWLQGIDNAPGMVKECYESVKANFKGWSIIVITSDNMKKFVEFPQFIMEKWKNGVISNTHFSDLLRIELLTRYGGLWLDATVYCTGTLPNYVLETDLFMYQNLKPGYTGHTNRISSWLMWAKADDHILNETKNLLWKYWEKEKKLYDYFLLHYFLTIVLNSHPKELQKIAPVSNTTPHILLLRLFKQYDEQIWQAIKAQTPFHKLTHKFTKEQAEMSGTFYRKLICGEQEDE